MIALVRTYNSSCLVSEFCAVKKSLEGRGYQVYDPFVHNDTATFTYVRSEDLKQIAENVFSNQGMSE